MEDRFTATAPIAFETALTTRAAWKALGPDLLELTAGGETLRVRIEASGPVRLTADTVEVNCPPLRPPGHRPDGQGRQRIHPAGDGPLTR